MPADPLNGLLAIVVFAFFVYAVAHTWLIRPIIGAIERIVGRRFFPFLDRVWPR